MKIAIQISGEFRMLHLSFEKFVKNIINTGNEIDIFIHSWKRDENGYGTFEYRERDNWHETMYIFNDKTGIELFKPVRYIIEDYNEKIFLHNLPRNMSMFYSIYIANEIRRKYEIEKNIKYDIVLRYRTDCIFEENPFDITSHIQGNYLCIPYPKHSKTSPEYDETDPFHKKNENLIITNDFTVWGTPDTMNIFTSIFIEWITKNREYSHSESMLSILLKENNILPHTILYQPHVNTYIVEGDGRNRVMI